MARRVVAIGARPRGATFRADHGNGNPVTVGNAGDDKLAPIAERARAEVGGGHPVTVAKTTMRVTGGVYRVLTDGRSVGHWRDTWRQKTAKSGSRQEQLTC